MTNVMPLCLCSLLVVAIACNAVISVVMADDVTTQARTILAHKCVACHSGEQPKGKLDLTTREKIFAGGDSGSAIAADLPETSALWQRVELDEMPPKHPLSDDEKRIFKAWIVAGAAWSGGPLDPLAVSSDHRAGLDWWSLQTLSRVRIPLAKSHKARSQPIDDFIMEQLDAKKLTMSPEADRRVLIRRVSFDLLGLPPTPEDVDQFVQDASPDAFERLVDRLLASPYHGERWARHWLDVVRFGESNGFERDLPRPHAWPYRDWVIDALNRDLPYDEFVRWQLAGDLIAPDNVEAMKAVGFLVAGAHDTVVPVIDTMRAAMRQDELEDIVGTVGQTFLGLTVNCARCHDHKFDPITSREYYQLASTLAGIDHGERDYTSPDVLRQLAAWQSRIDEMSKQLTEQEMPIREAILAERAAGISRPGTTVSVVNPVAAWDFTRDLQDHVGNLHVKLVGSAKRTDKGLVVDGSSYGRTSPLSRDLLEKTLEVRVRLKTLDQGGGAAMSVQTLSGDTFDAIVFAEREMARWMAGSEGFVRSASFEAPLENQADKEPVVITQVYRADGTIVAYRNGRPYGVSIRQSNAILFGASTSQILFGMRHGTEAGGNRMLNGTIVSARLYDKPLSSEEVAASADASDTYVSQAEILSKLSAEDQSMRLGRQNELKDLQDKHADLKKNGPIHLYTAIATQSGPMKIHQRGSVTALGDAVEPGGLTAIQGPTANFGLRPDALESHRRLRLANWITDANNPLFVRVMANRVWHYHFGAGLVESPSDLGFHAGMPSHPDLLEWLATEFQGPNRRTSSSATTDDRVDHGGYSLKRLHRMLVTSTTYRQTSTNNPIAAKTDASNRLLWRVSPRRLEAEEVRDAMLQIAGQLNSRIGGKGYSDVDSYFFKGTQFYDPIDPVGYANQRRTVYRMWARGGRNPFLDNFDCPDPSTTSPRRSVTVTPLQALSLLNHSFGLRMAEHFATRLNEEASESVDGQIQRAYRLLFGREPVSDEVTLGRNFVTRRGLPAFCRAMWNSSEFLFVD